MPTKKEDFTDKDIKALSEDDPETVKKPVALNVFMVTGIKTSNLSLSL